MVGSASAERLVAIWAPDMSVAGHVNEIHYANILGYGRDVLVKHGSEEAKRDRNKLHPVFKGVWASGKKSSQGEFVGYLRKGLVNVFSDVGSILYPKEFPPKQARHNELDIDSSLIANGTGAIDCPETGKRLLEKEGDLAVIAIFDPFESPPGPAVFVHPTALEKLLRCAPNSLLDAAKVGSDARNVYAICSVVSHEGRRLVDEEAGFVLEEAFAGYLPKANKRRIDSEPPF